MSNAAKYKLAPKQNHLTNEQQHLIDHIKDFAAQHINDKKHAVFTIYGDAGTGKSVVLSQLFYDLQQMSKQDGPLKDTKNYFLVNHPEILKVYKSIAGDEKNVLKKNFNRPTSFINQMNKKDGHADISVIDEAHLLLSQGDHYNNFYQNNQLTEIIKKSQITILVFDRRQVLRTKCFWNDERLKNIIKPYTQDSYHLKHQFRMTASDELVGWINNFTDGKLTDIPQNANDNYDFRIFDDAEKMHQAIVQKNNQTGLSRIVSTTGYPSTLDGGKHYLHEGDFEMPWDQYNYTSTPWAEIPETINEVGSIYTCQGFDLNYVGVILGPPIYLEPNTNNIKVDFNKVTDVESYKKRQDITNQKEFQEMKDQLTLNAVNVLMKRGVKGLYIFAHDKNLRNKLKQMFNNVKNKH